MTYYDYDPELPGGYQDADLEMARLEDSANHEARLKAKGICAHSNARGRKMGTAVICLDCGKRFTDFDELAEERSEILA